MNETNGTNGTDRTNGKHVLPVGTRIRFLQDLEEGACDEHPGLEFARKGNLGVVIGHDCKEGHRVKRDGPWGDFGAVLGEEFERYLET